MTYDKRLGIGVLYFACVAGVALWGVAMSACGSGSGTTSVESSACDDYFDTVLATGCCGRGYGESVFGCPSWTPIPASEIAQLRPRFDRWCESFLALPGQGIRPSDLEACVSSIQSSGCPLTGWAPTGACAFNRSGSLGSGAPCAADLQCQTGYCGSDAGYSALCGACALAPSIGQPCTGECGADAACVLDFDAGTTTCEALTYEDAGASCLAANALCSAGLVCTSSGVCAPPGAAGSPCQANFDCQPPLGCAGSTCQMPEPDGGPCVDDLGCQEGLGCNGNTCGPVSWASPGQPCSLDVRCFDRACALEPNSSSGFCPPVLPDGQKCTDSLQCEDYSVCFKGVCQPFSFAGVCP
jgi:hypothetical protein